MSHGRPLASPDAPASARELDPAGFDDVWALRESGRLPTRASWFCSPDPVATATAQLLSENDVGILDDLGEPADDGRDRLLLAVRRVLDVHADEDVVHEVIARMAKVNPPPPGYKKGGAVKMKAEGGTSKRGPRRDADGSPGAIRTMRNEREFMEMPEGTKQKHAMKSALGIQEKKKGGAVKKMKDGGTSKESSADMKQDKAVVRTAVHKHERAMHQGKPMTKLKKGGAAKSPCAAYKPKKMAAGGAAKERKDFPKVRRTKLTNAI